MKKVILLVAIFVASFAVGNAQTGVSFNDKTDIAVTYQFVRKDVTLQSVTNPNVHFDKATDQHGVNVGATYFFNNGNVGLTTEFGANKGGNPDSTVVTAMSGITIKRRNGVFNPFLTGVAGLSRTTPPTPRGDINRGADFGFAYALGGGLDVKLSKNVSLRLIRADFMQTTAFGEPKNSLRLGTGLVF
jgi:opacity protein-like surface antigen